MRPRSPETHDLERTMHVAAVYQKRHAPSNDPLTLELCWRIHAQRRTALGSRILWGRAPMTRGASRHEPARRKPVRQVRRTECAAPHKKVCIHSMNLKTMFW